MSENKEKKLDGFGIRYCDINFRDLDTENRTVDVIVSTETPTEMGYGIPEILLHRQGNVSLNRIKKVGSVLFNHNRDQIIGSIEDIYLDTMSKTLRAKVKFDRDQFSFDIYNKVINGSLKGVSVGYLVEEILIIDEGEKFLDFIGPLRLVTKWNPIEFSLVSVPADENSIILKSIPEENLSVRKLYLKDFKMGEKDEKFEQKDLIKELGKKLGKKVEENICEKTEIEIEEKELVIYTEESLKEKIDEKVEEIRSLYESAKIANLVIYALDEYFSGKSPLEIRLNLIKKLCEKRSEPIKPEKKENKNLLNELDRDDFVRKFCAIKM